METPTHQTPAKEPAEERPRLGDRIYDHASKLERERDKARADAAEYGDRVLELRTALERICDLEADDAGDPWATLEAIGAVAHNVIHYAGNDSGQATPTPTENA